MKRTRFSVVFASVLLIFSAFVSASEPWALVKLSVANLRSEPSHKAELSSQLTMGTPLKVICDDGVWLEVVGPDDYKGWVNSSSVTPLSDKQFKAWKKSPRVIAYDVFETHCYSSSSCNSVDCIVSDIVLGDIMRLKSDMVIDGRYNVMLPDGREAWIDTCAVADFKSWSQLPLDIKKVMNVAQSMFGQPYLWGGTSTKGVDCSGLVRVAFFANGLLLRRDASQQALTGRKIETADLLKSGDLIFFDNVGRGRVTHVGIYDRDGEYIHSSGRVRRNNLSKTSPSYTPSPVMGYVRIAGCEGTDGITRLCDHPWYFDRTGIKFKNNIVK